MSAMIRLSCAAVLVFALGCPSGETGAVIGQDDPAQTKLPKIKVNLPPPPSFQKDNAPESYPDGSYSVYGLRKNLEGALNKPARLKGFLIEVYECPECPKGQECPACRRPHFFVSDRANGPKDKALMVVDYPERHPETNKPIKLEAGAQYYVTGTFAKTSGTGFSASDGLMVFKDAVLVSAPE